MNLIRVFGYDCIIIALQGIFQVSAGLGYSLGRPLGALLYAVNL